MSDATLEIGRGERAALHQLLLQRLTGSIDPGLMIQREDFEAAERYANEFAADVRLLNDLGWNPEDRREVFAVTVSKDELSSTRNSRRGSKVVALRAKRRCSRRVGLPPVRATGQGFDS